ncbi:MULTISPECIES: hypothetical protein [unclassified Leptolyngbya]|uniref:hypothetical protein n=1 Tax=unclassified Leptolyngbya TaxID=2650499 RepID=UPI001688292A|nr:MULTISPECIES: hypothetical protein [unclassified Leptolyngbya]MBD1913861.1 hypothetical protein [Leptolyngbya sp. FACHB-8]MBD2157371.1 hypothetical protein [Leptolyngbya sp. FACHB-16]
MTSSVQTLLSAVVDYAGLFPPAQLSLPEAIGNYEQDRTSSQAWMLGRFVLPAGRVPELAFLTQSSGSEPWPLSVVLSGGLEAILEQMRSLQSVPPQATPSSSPLALAALEFPPLPPSALQSLLPQMPNGIDAFFEVPFTDPLPHLKALKGTGAFAKIRTGGIKAEAFPTVTQLSQFILACADAEVAFKATAGLHHALPGDHRLTYEPESPTAPMHGFLNVAIAATFAYSQAATLEDLSKILRETLAVRGDSSEKESGFVFESGGIRWGAHHISSTSIQATRQHFFHGFGSCSFQEPIHDLMELQLLETSLTPQKLATK